MHELKPARLDEVDEARAYRNKFPWKWIAIAVLIAGAIITTYQVKKHRDANAIRDRILRVHERDLAAPRNRILALERRIEGFVADALRRTPSGESDARLDVNQLRRGQGLYLRVPASAITSPSRVGDAARVMEADAIMNCMGLAPVSARTLFEKGQFLQPEWTHAARDTSDVLRLRVVEEQLLHHVRTDLPVAERATRSDWFMLAIERGSARTNAPVDFFVWNLRDGANLMSVRTEARGGFITARANLNGDAVGPAPAVVDRSAVAADCSIAAQVLDRTGNPTATATNTTPITPPAAAVAPPAAPAGAPAVGAPAPAIPAQP